MIKGFLKKMVLFVMCVLFYVGGIECAWAVEGDKSTIISPEYNYVDKDTGVRFYAAEGVVPENTHFVVVEIIPGLHKEDDENYRNAIKDLDEDKKNEAEHLDLYRIDLVNDKEEKIVPNGYIKVMLPVSDKFDESDIEVLKVVSGRDVIYKNEITTIDGNRYCVFETNNFSTYCLMDKLSGNETIKVYTPYFIYAGVLCAVCLLYVFAKSKRFK